MKRPPIHLRTARTQRKLSQQQLEARSLINQSTISRLERTAASRVSAEVRDALAAALAVYPPQRLRFGPEPKSPPRKRV
jgi:transcriptional regulator with XRE-family HTH domain